MKIKQGEKVYTANGEPAGEVDRIVLDPKTKEVTHIVVKKGKLFSEERVFPISLVQYSDEEQVKLRDAPVDLNELPVFEETHYIPLDDEEMKRMEVGNVPVAYYRYPPIFPGGWASQGEISRPYLEETVENIPEGTVALKEGAVVKDIYGDPVGDLKQILTDTRKDQVSHLVISEGVILKERKRIPIEWVSTIMEDEVQLAVGPKILEELPAF